MAASRRKGRSKKGNVRKRARALTQKKPSTRSSKSSQESVRAVSKKRSGSAGQSPATQQNSSPLRDYTNFRYTQEEVQAIRSPLPPPREGLPPDIFDRLLAYLERCAQECLQIKENLEIGQRDKNARTIRKELKELVPKLQKTIEALDNLRPATVHCLYPYLRYSPLFEISEAKGLRRKAPSEFDSGDVSDNPFVRALHDLNDMKSKAHWFLEDNEGQWLLPPGMKKKDGPDKNPPALVFAECCYDAFLHYTGKRGTRKYSAYPGRDSPSPFVAFLTAAMAPLKFNKPKLQNDLAQEIIAANKRATDPNA